MIDGADVPADGLAEAALAARGALEAALRFGDGLLGRKPRFHLREIPSPLGRLAQGHHGAPDLRSILGNIQVFPDTVRFRVSVG